MKINNAIILHGLQRRKSYYNPEDPSASNMIWLPWLQKQLIIHDITTQTPEMPRAWRPDYIAWSEELEHQLLTPNTLIVAHSCGAGFFLQWLTEHKDVTVGHVFLVAPWLGFASEYEDDPEDGQYAGGLFDFTITPEVLQQVSSLTMYHSLNDWPHVAKSVDKIHTAIPMITYREFSNMGHFTTKGMSRVNFDELLDDIVKLI